MTTKRERELLVYTRELLDSINRLTAERAELMKEIRKLRAELARRKK